MTLIDTYSTTNSKQVVKDAATGTYADAQAAATGDAVYTLNAAVHNVLHNSLIGGLWYIRRADLQFDTSAIPSGSTVTAASITLRTSSTNGADNDGYNLVAVDNTNQAALSATLATEDFNDFSATSIGSRDLTDFTNTNTNVAITLSSFAAIAMGASAITRIGLRLSGDISASIPLGANNLRLDLTADLPYLDVTWTTGGVTNTGRFFAVL